LINAGRLLDKRRLSGQTDPMARRITFLITVFVVLLISVILIGWVSKAFIFGKLEPPFLGALVAAAGAIFAACIAYSAAIENVRVAQNAAAAATKNRAEAERLLLRDQRQKAEEEAGQLFYLLEFLERLLELFKNARDQIGDGDYFSCYQHASRLGLLIPFSGNAPGHWPIRASELMQRLIEVRHAIARAEADLRTMGSGSGFNQERERLSASIRMIVADAKLFRDQVDNEAQRRNQALGPLLAEHGQ
jgi:hypothetical protein